MAVVIVESPAKAKTINRYLGNKYTVLASYGHVRDLNDKRGSVDPENNFSMKWPQNSEFPNSSFRNSETTVVQVFRNDQF